MEVIVCLYNCGKLIWYQLLENVLVTSTWRESEHFWRIWKDHLFLLIVLLKFCSFLLSLAVFYHGNLQFIHLISIISNIFHHLQEKKCSICHYFTYLCSCRFDGDFSGNLPLPQLLPCHNWCAQCLCLPSSSFLQFYHSCHILSHERVEGE